MGKYCKGLYEIKADEEKFNNTRNRYHVLNLISGLYQNDMTVTHEDLENVEKLIIELHVDLMSDFEETLDKIGKPKCIS